MARIALAAALAILAGCAPRLGASAPHADDLAVGAARFRIVYLPEDAPAAREVAEAVEGAVPRLARWGGIVVPVTITIHPTHDAFEQATGQDGLGPLRGWARYRAIELQSPRSWGPRDGGRARLRELVTHELAHCAMYQRAGDDTTWMYREIPRWFTEGLASVTAEQGPRVGGVDRLVEDLAPPAPGAARPDPLDGGPAPYAMRSDAMYRAAHHAFAFLLARYGEPRVRAILDGMAHGRHFPAAFRAAIGIGDAEFAAEFRRYVVWQGWRR